jgi:hypothetical protein
MSAPRKYSTAFAVAICAIIAVQPASGADEQFVYWPFVTDGTEYRRVAYPGEAGELVALAGSETVIEARQAGVTYWPITREYITEIGQGTPITGTLEIVGQGETIPVREETYTIWYPDGIGAGPVQLVKGPTADTLYGEYVSAARAAALKDQEYQRIVAEHQAAAEAWLKMAATRPMSQMPPPPPELQIEEPATFKPYASEPRKAAIVSLPEGNYTLRMRDPSGEVIAGSERALKIIAPIDQSVGYVVRPEDRWTMPLVSFSPQDTLYTTARTDLFLQPVPVVEYASRDFARIFEPQSIAAADSETTIWVPQKGTEQARAAQSLRVWQGVTQMGSIPKTGYRVNQFTGTGRGYTIDAFSQSPDGGVEPDFMAVRLESDDAADRIDVAGPLSGTGRAIVKVAPPPLWAIPLAALIPLLFGIGKRVWGKRSKKIATKNARARQASSDPAVGTDNKNTVSSFVHGRT